MAPAGRPALSPRDALHSAPLSVISLERDLTKGTIPPPPLPEAGHTRKLTSLKSGVKTRWPLV
jgi:hypothetical protein